MKKIVKILIITMLIVLLGGIYVFSKTMKQAQQNVQPAMTDVTEELQQIMSKVDAYYLNPQEKTFLKNEPVDFTELEALKEQVNNSNATSADKNRVLKEIEMLTWKQNAQDTVNELYNQSSEKVLVEDKVLENRVLATGLTNERMAVVREEILNNIPQRILQGDEESADDRFNTIVTELIEEATSKVEYYSVAEASFEKATNITIKDGEIGNIARAMRDFEFAQEKVTDTKMREDLTLQTNTYLKKFLAEFTLIVREIPGYYDLAIVAVEPSKLLTKLLEENKSSFVTNESEVAEGETTVETVSDTPSSPSTTIAPAPDTTVEPNVPEVTEEVIPETSDAQENTENAQE